MNFIKTYKNKLLKGMVIIFMLIMIVFSSAAFRGASSGLLLWFHNVLPALLPFIIISNLLIRLNVSTQISKVFHPILGKLFHVSSEGCYPIILGFLSGIPMGAKATSDLVAEQRISLKEGQFLVGMCNNASPMFILGYIAITQLKLPHIKYPLFAIVYTSSILGAIVYRLIFLRSSKNAATSESDLTYDNYASKYKSKRFTFDLIDSSIMNGFEIVTRIGGYIILFSILAQILKEIGPDSGLIKAFLIGILEITTGVSQICSVDINTKTKIVLVAALTTFGGISGIAQTKSVLLNSRLSIHSYFLIKLISAVIALSITYLYVSIFLIQ